MSPNPRFSRLMPPNRLNQYRCLFISALFLSGQGLFWLRPAIAIPNAGTVIENQATGSYQNDNSGTQTTQTIESDIVTLTVAEVAGINLSSGGITGSTVTGGLAYFDFVITNVGNDPTQFFIPDAPSAISAGGTKLGDITIVSYDSDGDGTVAAETLNQIVPSGGATTGTILGSIAAANNGLIPAGGTIRIRVPIQISATGGTINVTMGNTTPANSQNIPYTPVVGSKDVYTVDNPSETNGAPVNGEREASHTQSITLSATASAGLSFDCDPSFHMLRNDSSGNSQLYKINRQSNPYNQSLVISSGFSPALNLNALGYNPIDGYFYAMSSSSLSYNVLYRIGKNNAISLGVVQSNGALQLPNTSSFVSGTFDDVGNYYISNGTTLHKISISGNTPTLISSTVFTGIGSAGDIAFNPVDHKLYAANKSSTTGVNLQRIDNLTSSSASTTINIVTPYTSIAGSIGAIFFDSIGTLYAYSSSPAYFYQMPNVQSGSTTVTQVSSAFPSASTDGASCPFIPPRIDVVKSVGTVSRVNATTFDVPFTIKVGNTGADYSPNVQVTENLAKAFTTGTPTITVPTVTSTPSGICTINTSFDGITPGNMKLLSGTNTLPGGTSCTIALTAHLVYSAAGSVPTAIQNNSVYASTTINPNPGHTFTTDTNLTPIYPPDLLDADTSTNTSLLPTSVHGDIATATPITFPISSNPNVLLVKRITAINGQNITTYQQEDANPYDDNVIEPSLAPVLPKYPTADTDQWPNTIGKTSSTFLIGAIGGTVKPKDSIDYTIYFLSAGTGTANNVLFCDRVPANVTFVPNAFNSLPVGSGGLSNADRGIAIERNGSLKSYTNTADSDIARYFPPKQEPTYGDYAQYFPTTDPTKKVCNGPNDDGAVVVYLGNIPNSASVISPNTSYGFIRFRGLVK
jgi:uncharacterized repeat protein (TIGR01451 family)